MIRHPRGRNLEIFVKNYNLAIALPECAYWQLALVRSLAINVYSNPIWIVRRIPQESFSQQPFSLHNSFRIAISFC
jgi:hypothetical protein